MTIDLAVGEVSSWTNNTATKTVVLSCLAGDYLLAMIMSDSFPSGSVTGFATSTTVGSTSAWTEVVESLNAGGSEDSSGAAWATVTADGSITISVTRTMTGIQNEWGFYVLRARGASGIGTVAFNDNVVTSQTISLNVTTDGSAVAHICGDFDAGAVGSAWTPSGQTQIERTLSSSLSYFAAYWSDQLAGTRSYGFSGAGGSSFKHIAIEILATPVPVAPQVRSSGTYGSAATEASATVPLPAGWQAGDLCYIGWALLASTPSLTTPSGWSDAISTITSQQNANTLHGVMRRVLQAGDSAPVINFASGRFCAISVAITGYNTIGNPEDTAPTTDDGALATFPDVRIPSITSITANALMIAFAVSRNSTAGFPITWTPPSGMTEVAEVSATVSTIVAMELCKLDLLTPTTTGVKIATPAAGTFTGPAPMGSSIVIKTYTAPDLDRMILCQETGHHLLQENRHHLLLES